MSPLSPFTDVGALQADVQKIRYEVQAMQPQIHNKADTHEIHAIYSRMDNVEHSMREISAVLDGLCYRLEAIERENAPN